MQWFTSKFCMTLIYYYYYVLFLPWIFCQGRTSSGSGICALESWVNTEATSRIVCCFPKGEAEMNPNPPRQLSLWEEIGETRKNPRMNIYYRCSYSIYLWSKTICARDLGRVVQKPISDNPRLKFNRLFILVCSTWQLLLKFSKAKHFIVCMISEQKFIILSTKFPLILD